MGLPSAIGDVFLVKKNSVFRGVRKQVLSSGYQFKHSGNDLHLTYPLMGLNEIFRTKIIPVKPNFAVWDQIERERPGFFKEEWVSLFSIQKNQTLHESAHAIAFDRLYKSFSKYKKTPKDSAALLRVFMSEAFANACEIIAQWDCSSDLERHYLHLNIYSNLNLVQFRALENAMYRLGRSRTCLLLMLGYVHSLLFQELRKPAEIKPLLLEANRLLSLKSSSGSALEHRAAARLIDEIPMQLQQDFKGKSTLLYLYGSGFPEDLAKVYRFNPIELIHSENLEADFLYFLGFLS